MFERVDIVKTDKETKKELKKRERIIFALFCIMLSMIPLFFLSGNRTVSLIATVIGVIIFVLLWAITPVLLRREKHIKVEDETGAGTYKSSLSHSLSSLSGPVDPSDMSPRL